MPAAEPMQLDSPAPEQGLPVSVDACPAVPATGPENEEPNVQPVVMPPAAGYGTD
jgi:hypothetical protein